MTYANIAALMMDNAFFQRVNAACCEQALIYKDDARPEFVALATDVLTGSGGGSFMPFIAAQPGFGDVTDSDDITDQQLLAAVQAVWPTVAAMRFPQDVAA